MEVHDGGSQICYVCTHTQCSTLGAMTLLRVLSVARGVSFGGEEEGTPVVKIVTLGADRDEIRHRYALQQSVGTPHKFI